MKEHERIGASGRLNPGALHHLQEVWYSYPKIFEFKVCLSERPLLGAQEQRGMVRK